MGDKKEIETLSLEEINIEQLRGRAQLFCAGLSFYIENKGGEVTTSLFPANQEGIFHI